MDQRARIFLNALPPLFSITNGVLRVVESAVSLHSVFRLRIHAIAFHHSMTIVSERIAQLIPQIFFLL